MAGGNLFKRKGLLPFKGQGDGGNDALPPDGFAHDRSTETEGDVGDDDADDVFMRPTIVPDFGASPSGLESGPPSCNPRSNNPSDHNVTARPPSPRPRTTDGAADNANTFATIPAAANPHPRINVTRDRARDITPIESSPGPARNPDQGQSNAPDRSTPLAPPSQEELWGPTSAVDSGHNALGFVDALPRLTTRPPGREHYQPRHSEDGDRSSVISLSELFALSDYSGALQMAELRLAANPTDTEAQRYAQDCRRVLIKMQISRLGSLQQVAELSIDRDELQWLSLDHRAGFILSLVDGQLSIDDLLDICGMQRLDALQIVAELVEKKVLHLRGAQS